MEEQEFDKKMLFMTDCVAKMSKDNSTKVGCVVLQELDGSPISFGYNGMPRGLDDNHPERNMRPEKYQWYEHAERNTIYNKARTLLEGVIAFCSHMPDMESARALVSCGVKKVITTGRPLPPTLNPVWDSSKEASKEPWTEGTDITRIRALFRETDTQLLEIDLDDSSNDKPSQGSTLSWGLYAKLKNYLALTCSYGTIEESLGERACFLVKEDTLSPVSTGVCRPPQGFKALTQERQAEPHYWYLSAEKNAIYNVVRPILKGSVFYISWCPCMYCALAVAAVGARKVVTRRPSFKTDAEQRWREHFVRSEQLFGDMGIQYVALTEQEIGKPLFPSPFRKHS